MDIALALRQAAERAGWSITKIAAEVGVTEGQARKWVSGAVEPRFAHYRTLREVLPGFAALIDSQTAAA